MTMSDTERRDAERIETPMDPFDRLVLNPGRGVEAGGNPLCPDCEEPIRPWANQHERRFVCGCDELKRFSFNRPQDVGGDADE